MASLKSNFPEGKLEEKWSNYKFSANVVNPANKKKFQVIVVGAGLAGASAAASLAELGYSVKTFFFHDSPRRAHSIAAQGGINAAKNYSNDGDSVLRLFYDTLKGGDFRSREANVYRLAEISNQIIDHCVAQGIPFAREYGGGLANRSFGGAQVSRTFYARGQTGQQLLLGAYGSMMRQVEKGQVTLYPHREMLDLVVNENVVQGIVVRNLLTGEISSHFAHAVVLATGGYGNLFYLSTNAMNSNVTASWRCHKRGAFFANPSFVQIHPTCIPRSGEHQSKLTLMSESLRNDGRVWVPLKKGDKRSPQNIPEEERDYYLERIYPSFGNLVPRDVASRQAKFQVDQGKGVGQTKEAVFLDFSSVLKDHGKKRIQEKYGNLFNMYARITGENPYKSPMRIYPAVHYTMGGLWVDYDLQSNLPGLFVLGEANFSDHGANRLGASALMQGLADGYFILPYTLGNYLARLGEMSFKKEAFSQTEEEVREQLQKFLKFKGSQTVDQIHRKLGRVLWEKAGMIRRGEELKGAQKDIQKLKEEFLTDVFVSEEQGKNQELEKAARVADFLELAELVVKDAFVREESCGCHFREEYQTKEKEALRRDDLFCHVSAWEWKGLCEWEEHQESLSFEKVSLSQRNYK